MEMQEEGMDVQEEGMRHGCARRNCLSYVG